MSTNSQTSVQTVSVTRNFFGQQTVEALLLELIREKKEPAVPAALSHHPTVMQKCGSSRRTVALLYCAFIIA